VTGELLNSNQRIVHQRTAKTAKAMAFEVYEALAHNDDFYRQNRSANRWVARNWKQFIGHARAAHFEILRDPLNQYPQSMKDELYEVALIEGSFKSRNERRAAH
jgi:hypothetical protein